MGRGEGSYIRKAYREKVKSLGKCMYCGSTERLCIDHINPINKGGDSHLNNLTLACCYCNSFKSDYTIFEFSMRMIDKREYHINKLYGFINRARKYKRRESWDFYYKCIDNINKHWKRYKYFNKVIISLNNDDYLTYWHYE